MDASPPAKRRRQRIICSSSSSEDELETSPFPDRNATFRSINGIELASATSGVNRSAIKSSRPTASNSVPESSANLRSSRSTTRSTFPEKVKEKNQPAKGSRSLKDSLPQRSTKPLHNFFQRATQDQRWSSQKFDLQRKDKKTEVEAPLMTEQIGDDDDYIEDDFTSYNEVFGENGFLVHGYVTDGTKSMETLSSKCKSHSRSDQTPSTKFAARSKRFLFPKVFGQGFADQHDATTEQVDRRPWAQRFGPVNLDELAVHKKKVADVAGWLKAVFACKIRQRLLVLRGPAGSGKTTTISLLAQSMRFEVIEWRNPTIYGGAKEGLASFGAQFDDFLARGDQFATLELDESVLESAREKNNDANEGAAGQRIILVEEFPVMTGRNSSVLDSFRSSLQRYLAGSSSSAEHPPIVIIVSETLLSSAFSTSDNFTAHRLLGPAIYNHPCTSIIDFNTIAPTFMAKALKLVLEKEARQSRLTKVPGQSVLKAISDVGDIRSAISTLEFLCLKNDNNGANRSFTLLTKPKRTSANGGTLTSTEEQSLELITQREASLGIFHAVGKVVYNKRDDVHLDDDVKLPSPPDHLQHHDRPRASQVSISRLLDETGTDVQTFICALHENYVSSCDGLSFTEHLDGCIEALSDSDILYAPHRTLPGLSAAVIAGTRFSTAGVDMLRQDEISFHIAVRGLLFSLPFPVKRSPGAVNGRKSRKGDEYKIFFPTMLRQRSEYEQTEGLIDMWMKRYLDPSSGPRLGAGSSCIVQTEGVRAWKSLAVQKLSLPDLEGLHNGVHSLSMTMLSRHDMILYQLPYVAKITRRESELRELEKITGFRGIKGPSDSMGDNSLNVFDGPAAEAWTDTSELALSPSKPRHVFRARGNVNAFGPKSQPPVEGLEKLLLSEDDIED